MADFSRLTVGEAIEQITWNALDYGSDGGEETVSDGPDGFQTGAGCEKGGDGFRHRHPADPVLRRLVDLDNRPDRNALVPIARSLSAPGSPVNGRDAVRDAYDGIVVVEEAGSGNMPEPQGAVGTLACAAPPQEKIASSFPLNDGGVHLEGAFRRRAEGILQHQGVVDAEFGIFRNDRQQLPFREVRA